VNIHAYRELYGEGRGRRVIIALRVIVEDALLPHGRLCRLSVISRFFGRTGVNIERVVPPSHFNIVSSRSIIITKYTRLSYPDADTSDVL